MGPHGASYAIDINRSANSNSYRMRKAETRVYFRWVSIRAPDTREFPHTRMGLCMRPTRLMGFHEGPRKAMGHMVLPIHGR